MNHTSSTFNYYKQRKLQKNLYNLFQSTKTKRFNNLNKLRVKDNNKILYIKYILKVSHTLLKKYGFCFIYFD